MFRLIGIPLWPWLAVSSLLSAAIGSLVSWKKLWPGGVLRERAYQWRPISGGVAGFLAGILLGNYVISSPLVVVPVAFFAAWGWARHPDFKLRQFFENAVRRVLSVSKEQPPNTNGELSVEQMVFQPNWNARPRFESDDKPRFVGREYLIKRLRSHFMAKGGGTILISGVRGVGKTAVVDRALADARQKLCDVYWENAAKFLDGRRKFWHPIDWLVAHSLATLGDNTLSQNVKRTTESRRLTGEQLKRGADKYVEGKDHRDWKSINPIRTRIIKMYTAANWQLLVLKFSASDIAGALAEPDQKLPEKPHIDPEKLLRSLIRKLYTNYHPTSSQRAARILEWSLWNKKVRRGFVDNLQKAYDKSISKSYKEIISNSENEFIKRQWSADAETKIDVVRVVSLLVVIAIFALSVTPQVFTYLNRSVDMTPTWITVLRKLVQVISGVIVVYVSSTLVMKWSRSTGSDRNRQAQFSYENDYSLERMQSDLESLLQTLTPPDIVEFHPYQCFTRSVVVFDELDKLEDADKQLDDVISHFKNFFTLSNTMFVFLTDHQFYEHLYRETAKAQQAGYYPPHHTFFTEKIYLRKPKFARFREAFYNFANRDWLLKRAQSLPSDPVLIDYLLRRKPSEQDGGVEKDVVAEELIASLPLESLTYLYIHRSEYEAPIRKPIENAFAGKQGHRDPLALAQIWAGLAASDAEAKEIKETEAEFQRREGWKNAEAVALLYYCKDNFADKEQQNTITEWYEELSKPPLTKYESVKAIPFCLGDLAHALCFQTRNHYFDLYHLVYDYVNEYHEASPIIEFEDKRFAPETRLFSRYQRLIEIVFEGFKDTHPSREHFNATLMEALYAVFDKRASRQAAKVTDMMFHTDGVGMATSGDEPDPTGDEHDLPISNGRDVQTINKAIARLLELASLHNAISPKTKKFEERLKSLNPSQLKDLQFEWNDDISSIIKSTRKEPHERKLIHFWNDNQPELEALEVELVLLWKTAAMPEDGTRMRAAIRDLRTKTETMRHGKLQISKSEADALEASVLTPESRYRLVAGMILKRIRVEDDATIIQDPVSASTNAAFSEVEARKRNLQTITGLQVQAAIVPGDADCCVFLISAPVPTGEQPWRDFLKDNEFILWFTSSREEVTDGDRLWFYYLPPRSSAATLFTDYIDLATTARLQRIASHLQAAEYNDPALAKRAGAEAIGFIGSGSDFQTALSNPSIQIVDYRVQKLRSDFIGFQTHTWRLLGKENPTSALDAVTKVAEYVSAVSAFSDNPAPFDLKLVIEDSLKELFGPSLQDMTVDTWIKLFTSSRLEAFANLLYKTLIRQLVRSAVEARITADEALREAATPEFTLWITQAIDNLAANNNLALGEMLSAPDWANELEKQRRGLRTPPLPPNPTPRRGFHWPKFQRRPRQEQ